MLHGPACHFFVWRGSGSGFVKPREPLRPLAEGVLFPPPPTEKNQDTIFPAVSGRVPISLSGHSLKLQRECIPKTLLPQKFKTPFSPQFRGVSRFSFQDTL